jgi:glucose/arabinose dehydrogenase
MKHFFTLSSLALLLLLTHCGGSDTENPAAPDATPNDPVRGPIIRSERQNFGIDTLASGLNNPWGLAFLPDGRILVTERSGEIRIIQNGRLTTERIQNVPAVFRVGQGGLLDIQTHPQFASNGLIYFCYSRPGSGGGATALARARLQGNSFTEVQELFVGQPFSNSAYHFGSRIAFDDQGHVFLSTGDRGTPAHSQNLGNHWGKILRLRDDGRVPADNPFVNTANARPEIWSFGHRNVQGLVFDAATRTLWAHEHGPRGGDELNRIEPGRNYGWPAITHGVNYDGTPVSGETQRAGMEQPVRQWTPSIAPCGMALVTSTRYPNWRGNLLIGALAQAHVARVELTAAGAYVREERLLANQARFRCVAQSPDGYIHIASETPGMVLRLVPAN